MAEQIHATFLPMIPNRTGNCACCPYEPMPSDLFGARIIQIGTIEEDVLSGGGLVIQYLPAGSEDENVIVFEFNDQGMGVTRKNLVLDISVPSLDGVQESLP